MSVGCLLPDILVVGMTGVEAEACGDVATGGDRDLETGGGVENHEVGGGDTWGRKEVAFVTLGGDTVRFESEKVRDTSGEGLSYVAWATDPTLLQTVRDFLWSSPCSSIIQQCNSMFAHFTFYP